MEIELRRCRISLMTLGSGVFAFGVWSILKSYLYLWVNPVVFDDIAAQYQSAVNIIFYVMYTFLVLIDLLLRAYVGMGAHSMGMGKKKGPMYMIVLSLMLATSVLSCLLMVMGRENARMENQSKMDYLVSAFVEFCNMSVLAELLYTVVRVRKLEKRTEG
ncbi:MAG: hypothetical protein IJ649_06810 [Oscillospiraceae bacterium]|nr:hypothetical protein [Oscillospiraceae bacterium]